MKLRTWRLALITICIVSASAVMAATPAPTAGTDTAGVVTVGDFAVKLADALNTTGHEIDTLSQAKEYFASRGITLPSSVDLTATLTQRDVSVLCSLVGVNVEAAEPEKSFDKDSVEGFVGYLREEVEAGTTAKNVNTADYDKRRASPAGLGACCVTGSCISNVGNAFCASLGGTFKGSGVSCTPDPCAAGVGTCCLGLGGPCIFTDSASCVAQGGRFRGTLVCTAKTCSREPESPTQPK
jgi:hypothetical protein